MRVFQICSQLFSYLVVLNLHFLLLRRKNCEILSTREQKFLEATCSSWYQKGKKRNKIIWTVYYLSLLDEYQNDKRFTSAIASSTMYRNAKHHFLQSSMFSGGNEATLTRKGNLFIPLKTLVSRPSLFNQPFAPLERNINACKICKMQEGDGVAVFRQYRGT